MGKVNTAAKQYMKKNENIADLCNFYIYGGRQVVHPEDLSELDTVSIEMIYDEALKKLPIERIRDILKFMTVKTDGHAVYAVLGIENQKKIHYAMPIRSMIYDALTYVEQVKNIADCHKRDKEWKDHSEDEYLSGFYKDDRIFPVITIVVYFGAEKWDGPLSLREMLVKENEELLALINDYKIHLITPEGLTDEELGMFRTSLKEVFTFIKYSKDEKKLDELIRKNKEYESLERSAAMVLNECTNLNIKLSSGKENVNMCKAWDDHKKRGIEEGIEKGMKGFVEICQEMGMSRNIIIEKIMVKYEFEEDQAERYVSQYWVA